MSKLEIDIKEFWPVINEVISSGGEFRLFHKGKSMMPLLREGIDSVLLTKAESVEKNDIILFQRDDGTFVLHRAVKIKKNQYVMCGDYQGKLEYGITDKHVLAKVKGIFRGDEYFEINNKDKAYKKYLKGLPFKRFKIRMLFRLGINK